MAHQNVNKIIHVFIKSMKISLQYSIEKTGLPLIVTSGKPNLCFLIDTGASHNIIFSYVYEELPNLFSATPCQLSQVIGIDGIRKRLIQVNATLPFDNNKVPSTFSVLDATEAVIQVQQESGIQIHGILGIPFLTQNKWILDFDTLTMYRL